MTDPGLDALLAAEIERRLADIGSADVSRTRSALHGLRGSSAMAGHADLSLVISHFSGRLRAGDVSAAGDARELLASALQRLRAGEKPFASSWPEPPPGLGASRIDPRYRVEYQAAAHDRLADLHAALEASLAPLAAVEQATRAVHSLKGAAGSIGDDATAWYCHGLESRLRAAEEDEALARKALLDLPRHASALALLIEDQASALETLRGKPVSSPFSAASALETAPVGSSPKHAASVGSAPKHAAPVAHGRRPSSPPGSDEDTGEHTVRVQGVSLDRVLDRLERIQLVHDDVSGLTVATQTSAQRLRDFGEELQDALRLLGPPRPWGPPAAALSRIDGIARALGATAENLAHGSAMGRAGAERLRAATNDIRREVSLVRRTTLSDVVSRVATGIERLASREGRNVRVRVSAVDAPIDREVAERLVDPLMQLARNALAHGIEPEDERVSRGKDPIGTLMFTAERVGDFLRIVCEDDGRGVDMECIRRLAAERKLVSAEAARSASDDELLGLLFVPGLTTRAEADLLAGRGVGLDISLSLVRRLGGSIRLARRERGGFMATIELPSERWMTDVLWIGAGRWTLALPVSFTGRIERTDPHRPPVHLCKCLGEPTPKLPALSLELALSGIPTVSIGIDSVGEVEECSLRPLPSAVAAAGPFSGAIVRGDGALNLALDAALLAVRAWALA